MANRKKMSKKERAKQFIPFSALKGLNEALQKKENKKRNFKKIKINN